MAQPDASKKLVSQTGYADKVDAPFTENYQDLYREMLVKYRVLYEKVDEIGLLVDEIDDLIAETGPHIKVLIGEIRELINKNEDNEI